MAKNFASVKKIALKAIIIIFAVSIMAVSVYFGIGFFEWWGFNFFFSVIISFIVTCLMDILFQFIVYMFKEKKKKIAGALIPVWLIFFAASIFGTFVGMNFKTEEAKQKRLETSRETQKENPLLVQVEKEIEENKKLYDALLKEYNNPKYNEMEWGYYYKDKNIKPALDKAKTDYDKSLEEKKELLKTFENQQTRQELFLTKTGQIEPVLKIVLSVLFGFLIDIGSCIVFAISWIFEKKENVLEVVKNEVKQIEKPKTYNDYIKAYVNARVNGSDVLRGRTSKEVLAANIPVTIFHEITVKAVRKNLLIVDKQATRLAFGVEKETLLKGLLE